MNDLSSAVLAVTEPQHEALEAFREHGQCWVQCKACGRSWSVQGSVAEVVAEGDGTCDDS
jgi:hypothetical protein